MSLQRLYTPYARIGSQWERDVVLAWDQQGTLHEVNTNQDRAKLANNTQIIRGAVISGMPNLHSHAFQSAMAGLTEYRGTTADSFWSWRDLMYRFAAKLNPDDIHHIARWLYIDMLKAGYTSVCEFHYIHHQSDGTPYSLRSELAAQVCQAAEQSGIGLTMLPVLYQYSNFGAEAPRADQARFLNSPDQLLALLHELQHAFPQNPQRRYGVAPHSLRAVSAESLNTLLNGLATDFPHAPIHIHIAEQLAEVEASVATTGLRPVEWLYQHMDVDTRWCLVHATHLTCDELSRIAHSGSVAGLCLTTEANLGDGIFPAHEYLRSGGRFGVGSDSHISVDWRAELRLLEYGQRLSRNERNVLHAPGQPQVAEYLFDAALQGGAQASARAIGQLRVGHQADFIVLDTEHSTLAEHSPDTWLASLIFNERSSHAIRDVYVAGQARVIDGHHADERDAFAQYRRTLHRLIHD